MEFSAEHHAGPFAIASLKFTYSSIVVSSPFRSTMRVSIVILGLFLSSLSIYAQNKVQQKLPEKTRILFVLDGSGSMEGIWEGKESRMEIAKKILTKLVDSLRTNQNLELALRVYGHRFNRQANNCQDTQLEVPFGVKNHNTIINKLKEITPRGTTPITYSLQQAAKDFPAATGYRNILILITDGIESCGGDPCAASIEFQRKGIFLRPFIIGLGLDGGKALDCAGKYIDAQNTSAFNNVLNKTIETTFSKTTLSIEVLNNNGVPFENNTNISLINSTAGNPVYEFVHYIDRQGRPDSVQIDPVPGYDMIVHTLPPIIQKNISVESGRHNVIRVKAPQGNLVVKSEGKGFVFNAIIREKDKREILNQQQSGESYRYLAGSYTIETITFPRRTFDVTIDADKINTLALPAPGVVNISTRAAGYGSIFEVMSDGREVWVCKLDETKATHAYNLLPGTYRIAFRARAASGSKYTGVKTFIINSGKTTSVNVFN
jgi:Ca-activated chloride channel family protein